MKTNKVNLGKVCVTIDKDYWDINKDYDKLVIVEVENAYATYMSRQPVPHGTDIENKEYWCLFSKYNKNYLANEGVFNVSKYLKIKDIVSNVVPLTLAEAVVACPSVAKNAGQIITFINSNKEWQRYQYQGYNVANWNQLTLWKDLNNVSEDIPVSEDVMSFNITEYMPGGSKYKQAIWAGIYTIDGITPVSQYRVIFGCDASLGIVEGVDMDASDTLAIIDIDTDEVAVFSYILFVGNSIDGYRYQTTIDSDEEVPDWIAKAFGNNSSYILANIASLERRVNDKLADKAFIVRVDDYLNSSKEMPNGYFMFEQQPVSQIRVLYDSDAYLLYIQAAVDGTGTMYFAFENADEYYDSWRYLNQYTEENCPSHVLEAFGLNVATSNKKGMMSATDKTNLEGSFKNVSYNANTKRLIFTKNNNTTVELDATPFIKDGMIDSVSIVNGYLVITFNTDSGKETIRIALADIFNPDNYYTKAQTNNLLGDKVDKEQGKGLSTNDYTAADKDKLNALPTVTELTRELESKADSDAIEVIEQKIPAQASSDNKLADKNFVNSSIATNTANYISDNGQPFQSVEDLEAYSGVLTNNDYAFVVGVDSVGNTTYSRYKYNASTQQWTFEYVLNNSSFTAEQWAAINSSITSALVTKLSALPTNSELVTLLNGKADVTDLIPVDNIWQWSNTAYLRATDIQTLDGVWIDKSATSATKEKYIYINKLSSNLIVFTSGYYSFNFNNGFIIPKGQQMIRDENMKTAIQTALLHVPYSGLLSLWMGTPSDVASASQYVEIVDSENNVIKHYSTDTLSQLSSPIILRVNSGNYYIRYFRVNFFFHSAMLVRYELPLSELLDDSTHRLVSDDEKTAWNNKSNFSGSYNDLSDKPDLSSFITKSVDDLMNYYLKSETYTKTEVLQLIGAIQQFHYEVYPTLPQTGASNVLYLIGPTGTGTDKYEEYVYANNDWTKIGDTSIDLSGYVTTEALNTALTDYVTSSALSTALAGKENTANKKTTIAGNEGDDTYYPSTKAVAVYVEEAKKQMLRELYLSTDPRPDSDVNRLRYNDTGADIIRTAEWGERIVHKAGHYWLNGLGDITEDEMSKIYSNGGIINPRPDDNTGNYLTTGRYQFRTNLNIAQMSWNSAIQYQFTAMYNKIIRVINLGNNNPQYVNGFRQFGSNGSVCKAIIPALEISGINKTGSANNSFYGARVGQDFMYAMLNNIVIDCPLFKYTPLIMYKCLKYLVDNAGNTSAITVTVHATTYGYLTDSSTLPIEHSGIVETPADIATVTDEELVGMKEWDETTKKYVYATKAEWQQIVTDATAKNISFASA